jgi:uncharacterized SAM-binding protein YcdF (DUF218 family)
MDPTGSETMPSKHSALAVSGRGLRRWLTSRTLGDADDGNDLTLKLEMHAPNRNLTCVPPTRRAARLHRARRFLTVILVMAGLGWLTWAEQAPLLRGLANLWIVSDPVTSADAAVVLGGGLEVRPFAAADLYRRGVVRKVLVSQVGEERAVNVGAARGHTEINRQVLVNLGVPADAIEIFGISNKNTRDEALALRNWAEQHAVRALIIPTEIFGARRVRWIFQREFAEQAIRIEVPSFDPPAYTRADWWTTERGLIEFQNEILKYLYYRLRY